MNYASGATERQLYRQVRDALTHVYDPVSLRRHPLGRLLMDTDDQRNRVSDSGQWLRDRLLSAIEACKPAAEVASDSRLWRSYNLLHARYVEAHDAVEVQRRLSLSKSTYYAEHEQAIAAVAARLSPELPSQAVPRLPTEPPLQVLPTYLTSFVGREEVLAEAARLLSTSRLLTFTGPGGTGKTRLALRLASQVVDEFPDGIRVADLGVVREAELVLPTVMLAFQIKEEPGKIRLQALTDGVGSQRTLLLLDNCEHYLDIAANVAETLLKACSGVRILATSTEPLASEGEVIWEISPLATPDPQALPNLVPLADVYSVRLFIDRAKAVEPHFALTQQNAEAVAEICYQLDGVPLAIELAAAQLQALSPEQIAQRLDDRFGLLTLGVRTAMPHHQTLRALVDWSYSTLSELQQRLQRRLSVFAGGFELEAIEGVCAGNGILKSQVVHLLRQLVAKSLVLAVDSNSGSKSYRLLETIRQYAHELLEAEGELSWLEERHVHHYLELTMAAVDELKGVGRRRALGRLDSEYQNVGAALGTSRRYAADRFEWAQRGLELAEALWWYWYVRNQWSEAFEWMRSLTEATVHLHTPLRSRALVKAAWLAWELGHIPSARTLEAEGARIARETGDAGALGWSALLRGIRVIYSGHHRDAIADLREALRRFEELGLPWETAISRTFLGGALLFGGDEAAAMGQLQLALASMREFGEYRGLGYALIYLGLKEMWAGNLEKAKTYFLEGVRAAERNADPTGTFEFSNRLAQVDLLEEDYEAAGQRFMESLHFHEGARQWGLPVAVAGLALVAAGRNQPETAVKLLAAASSLYAQLGTERPAFERTWHDRQVATLRAELGPERFGVAWNDGEAMDHVGVMLSAESVVMKF